MKTLLARLSTPCAALLMSGAGFMGVSSTPCHAQAVTEVRESTAVRETRVDGRLHVINPDSIAIVSGEAAPATYRYGDAIQFVDEAGRVVPRERIVPGTPVSVITVAQPSGGIVTNRVVVHTTTTTTVPPGGGAAVTTTTVTETTVKPTEANGVLLEREADRVLVRTPKDGDITFMYSRVTDFTDSEGRRVDLIKFVPGMPVHVDFKQVGDRLEASRIMFQGRLKE